MSASDIISALKEFLLDIIGYLIPGSFAFIIINLTIKDRLKLNTLDLQIPSEYQVITFILISYILGYSLYSLSSLIDPIVQYIKRKRLLLFSYAKSKVQYGVNFIYITSRPRKTVLEPEEIRISKLMLNTIIQQHASNFDANSLKLNNLRSLIMSYIPEADTKIYTFRFRAELSRIIESFGLAYAVIGLVLSFLERSFSLKLFLKADNKALTVYLLLILCSYFLGKTRRRFENIADKIPYSIFIAKFAKIN